MSIPWILINIAICDNNPVEPLTKNIYKSVLVSGSIDFPKISVVCLFTKKSPQLVAAACRGVYF
jgi:hypothetical protein